MKAITRRTLTTILSLNAACLLMAGCALNRSNLVLDPVGPPPGAAGGGNSKGVLIVFSAFSAYGDGSGFDRPAYSSYQLLADGQPPRQMENNPGNALGGPIPATLDPGTYTVVARANGYGMVKVPVVIQSGKTTVLHLEGGGSWPNRDEMIRVGASRLPDGRIVGWKARQ